MHGFTKAVLATALASAALHGGACLSDTASHDPALDGVVLEGDATRPALGTVVHIHPIENAALGPLIVSPSPDTVLPPTPVLTFAWEPQGPTASHRSPPAPAARAPVSPFPAFFAASRSPQTAVVPAWLRDLLGPERSATAAEAPLSGRGYLLVFSTPVDPKVLRVFTTRTTYTPDAKAWKALRAVGMWTKLTILAAEFQNDAALPEIGPFTGTPVEFCIEPE